MPRKLPRRRDEGELVPSNSPTAIPIDPRTALILGVAHVTHGTVQATARVLEASIESFGQCFCAFVGYMREREITSRVIATERAATARMQAWSDAVIADAEAKTEQVRIQATLVLAAIEDRKSQRHSKQEVIQGFMMVYQGWNATLMEALARRADQMPLDERESFQKHIDGLFQQAREMERTIASIAITL